MLLGVATQVCLGAKDSVATTLQYPDDLNKEVVDSFFKSHTIDLTKCDFPDLYFEVFRWYKTCYRYGGSSENGIDCSGFVNMVYKKIFNVELPRGSYLMYPKCRPLEPDELPAEGDLVFFKIYKNRISHVGIYLQHNKFAHSSTHSGVIISDLNEPYYKKHFYRAGRVE